MNLHESPDAFAEFIQATAQTYSIPEVYVEKDYWVTKALQRLSESEFAAHIVFKGGTALSKAHRLIRRFSEDIDLATKSSGASQSQTKALMRGAEAAATVDFKYQENHALESKGSKFRKTVYAYPTPRASEDFGQVANHIVLEVNAFTTPEPSSALPISALVHDLLNEQGLAALIDQYALKPFSLDVLSVERTLCEKILGLTRACYEDDENAALRRQIRHVYDICMILRRNSSVEFVQSDAFGSLMEKVQESDRWLFREAERWLAKPVHDAPIYAIPEKIWATLAGELQGNFRQMLYDDDVPDDAEVIAVLDMLGLQLRKSRS